MSPSHPVINFLNKFVPASLGSGDIDLSWEQQVRVWAMVAVLGISILVPFSALVIFTIVHFTTGLDFIMAMVCIGLVVLLLCAQHVYFQSFGNLRVTAAAYSVQYFMSIALSAWFTGGWHSPALVLFLCSPMIAFMTIGYKSAITHVNLVFAALAVFFIFSLIDYPLPNVQSQETREYTLFIIYFMLLSVLAVFLSVCNLFARGKL